VVAGSGLAEASLADFFAQATTRRPELAARFVFVTTDPAPADLAALAEVTGSAVLVRPVEAARILAVLELIDRRHGASGSL
jgi:hypothetical protein